MRITLQMTALAAVVAVAAATPTGGAVAQATPGGGVESFMASTFRKGLVARSLERIPAVVLRKCPDMRAPGSSVLMIKPLVFAPDGYPTAGIWKERLPITGCGADVTINILFTATPDEKVNAIIELPGSTQADPVLQRDARTIALARARDSPQDLQRIRGHQHDLPWPWRVGRTCWNADRQCTAARLVGNVDARGLRTYP